MSKTGFVHKLTPNVYIFTVTIAQSRDCAVMRAGQGRAKQSSAGQSKPEQGRAGQDRAGQASAEQGRARQGSSSSSTFD